MTKPANRNYSRHTRQALALLGGLVRAGRIERHMTARELSERAGISRDMLHRVEKGDPRCGIGVAFELAAIVGVPLFEPELAGLRSREREVRERLALLPKAVRKEAKEVKDDF